ncbi:hypothetical protein U2W12_17500 [Methylomicrobium sp. Wu6]|nr:hypothetical protein [Methylomicrobium sp. Wu6]
MPNGAINDFNNAGKTLSALFIATIVVISDAEAASLNTCRFGRMVQAIAIVLLRIFPPKHCLIN